MAEHSEHELTSVPATIRDEAGETPMWVPIVGLVLLALVGVSFAIRTAIESGPLGEGAAVVVPDAEAL